MPVHAGACGGKRMRGVDCGSFRKKSLPSEKGNCFVTS